MALKLILPEIIISLTGIAVLIGDLFIEERRRKRFLGGIAVLGPVLAILRILSIFSAQQTVFYGMFTINHFSQIIKIILLISASLVILLSIDYFREDLVRKGEYYSLILFSVAGMMFMVSANDFLGFFLSLQLTSIPLYILSGFDKNDARSNEAAYKYLMLGMLASVVMLYGITFIYGLTTATNYGAIAQGLIRVDILNQQALLMAMFFIFAGFAFKIAAVPFHFWVPDTYEGSPTPVTTFLATAPKVAGFAALIHLLSSAFSPLIFQWRPVFLILSLLSMCVGNIVALSQTNIKRMLGFSSIAHVGYILMAFAVANPMAYTAAIFYLMIYCTVNIGAFAVVASVFKGEHRIDKMTGLSKLSPFMSFSIAIFFLSMIGIPPTPGFWGKFDLFASAIDSGMTWLAVAGIVNSVISVYYYIDVLRYIFVEKGESSVTLEIPRLMKFVVGATLCLTILMALYPQPFIEIAKKAAMSLLL